MSVRIKLLGFLLILFAFFCLSGCCTFRSCEFSDEINVSASQQLNSCSGAGQHPVTLRFFGLTDVSAFGQASFDELWHQGESTLGNESVYMIEKVVMPGQAISVEPIRKDGVIAIGIVANYCRLESNCWRKTIRLGEKTQKIELELEKTCISIK